MLVPFHGGESSEGPRGRKANMQGVNRAQHPIQSLSVPGSLLFSNPGGIGAG